MQSRSIDTNQIFVCLLKITIPYTQKKFVTHPLKSFSYERQIDDFHIRVRTYTMHVFALFDFIRCSSLQWPYYKVFAWKNSSLRYLPHAHKWMGFWRKREKVERNSNYIAIWRHSPSSVSLVTLTVICCDCFMQSTWNMIWLIIMSTSLRKREKRTLYRCELCRI